MKRFKNISLVIECDPSTLERAATLARDNRAKLTIIYPAKEPPASARRVSVGGKRVDVRALLSQELQARLSAAARSSRTLGVRAATRLLFGDPFLEVIRDVLENRRDRVIMTAESEGGLKQQLFGSTSRHLMRKCPVPLLVTKPGRRKRFHRILAAIDPSARGGPETRSTKPFSNWRCPCRRAKTPTCMSSALGHSSASEFCVAAAECAPQR